MPAEQWTTVGIPPSREQRRTRRSEVLRITARGDCASVDTPVSVNRIVETGSLTLKERTASAVSEEGSSPVLKPDAG